jgi:hypothetical protein
MAESEYPQGRTTEEEALEAAPANVVADNSGVVPVQPIATTDPTITDNTNPRVPFDGALPENIPPHDSNEQLHISASKRFESEMRHLGGQPDLRREAVAAAYSNEGNVLEVLGQTDDQRSRAAEEEQERGRRRAEQAREMAGQYTPPQGRAADARRQTAEQSKPSSTASALGKDETTPAEEQSSGSGSGSERRGGKSGGGKS